MTRHVTGSTHSEGHTLDLIITRCDENVAYDVQILPDFFSDHKVVTCKLDCPKPPASKIHVTYRSTKLLTADILDDGVLKLPFVKDLNALAVVDLTALVIQYNTELEKIYNDLAPRKSRWITHRPHAPWYNDVLRLAKRIKRRAERMFRKTGLEVHRGIFVEACKNYQKQLEFHKSSYYKTRIKQAGRNKLFQIIDNLFQPGSSALPSYSSLESLVEDFNDFLIGKIQSIRDEIQENAVNHSMQSQSPPLAHEFNLMRVLRSEGAFVNTSLTKTSNY